MKTKQIILEINDYSDLNKEELESKLMELSMRLMLESNKGEDIEGVAKLMFEVKDLTKLLEEYL
jgi:hypothetical protein